MEPDAGADTQISSLGNSSMKQNLQRVTFVLALTLSGCGDGGQSSDNGSEFGPWVYSTSEPGEYTLNMAKSVWADEKEPNKVQHSDIVLTTKIPKSLLSVCFPYSRSKGTSPMFKVKSLPDEIFCNKISFNMNYVDGKSLQNSTMFRDEHFEDYIRKSPKPLPVIMGKLPDIPREDQPRVTWRRYFEMTADVYPRKNLGKFDYPEGRVMRRNRIGQLEGLEVYKSQNSSWTGYFDEQASDGLNYILCVAPPDRTHPEFFCSAHIVINDDLVAKVDFVDFRVHGGRQFLRDRIRAFKKHVCPILKCSSEALQAADVVGGF
jgi:hypothetical protein